jgi:hypothetical protein
MRSDDVERTIDEVVARGQVWEPPAHFARTVGAQASDLVARERAKGELAAGSLVFRPAMLGVLTAVTAYVGYLLVLAPMTEWLVSDRAVATFDAYLRFIPQAPEQWAATGITVAWTSAAISLAIGAWFTRGVRLSVLLRR